MSGKKGRSGRHKSLGTIMNEALERIDESFPELIEELIKNALKGNQEAIEYALDRRIGKPSIRAVVSPGEDVVSVEEVMRFRKQMDEGRNTLKVESPSLEELYTREYGDRAEGRWPKWAEEAVDNPRVFEHNKPKALQEGVTLESVTQDEDSQEELTPN